MAVDGVSGDTGEGAVSVGCSGENCTGMTDAGEGCCGDGILSYGVPVSAEVNGLAILFPLILAGLPPNLLLLARGLSGAAGVAKR